MRRIGYLERSLLPGERLVHRTGLHWFTLCWPAVFLVLALVWGQARFVLTVLAVFTGIPGIMSYAASEFGVTDRRVLFKSGSAGIRSLDLLLPKVEGVEVVQGPTGRILGFGTVAVLGAGGTRQLFRLVKAPLELRRQVLQQIEALAGDCRPVEGPDAT